MRRTANNQKPSSQELTKKAENKSAATAQCVYAACLHAPEMKTFSVEHITSHVETCFGVAGSDETMHFYHNPATKQ